MTPPSSNGIHAFLSKQRGVYLSLSVVPAPTSWRSLKCSQSADAHAACAQSSWPLLGLLSQRSSTSGGLAAVKATWA